MTNPPLQNPHALAIIDVLETHELLVGDGKRPAAAVDGDGAVLGPYSVLYLLPGPSPTGSLSAPDDDADLRFQLTHVGRVAAEARWQADRAHQALLAAAPITVAERSTCRLRKVGGSDGIQRDEDTDPPLFYDVAIYGLFTTPT